MTGPYRFAVLGLACCGLLPLAACSRTSDGTVIVPKPPAVSSLLPSWRLAGTRQPEPVPESVVAMQVQPDLTPPDPPRAKAKPPVRLGPTAKLACHNQTEANGRVQVVCD